jgi:hypothetical protein
MTKIDVPNTGARRRGRFGRFLLILLVLIVAGTCLWTWVALSWAYAEGERAGVLQKFARRGWVCKTNEGEIALYYGGGQYLGPANSRQFWDFSVRDPSVADQLNRAVGHRVQLHYSEHKGVPTSCFGETGFYVDKVTVTDGEPGPAPGSTPVPAAPTP